MPRIGGAPFYAAQALHELGVRGTILARCGPAEREEYGRLLVALGVPVTLLTGTPLSELQVDPAR